MCTHQTGEGIMSSIMTLKNKKKICSDIKTGETVLVRDRQTYVIEKMGVERRETETERERIDWDGCCSLKGQCSSRDWLCVHRVFSMERYEDFLAHWNSFVCLKEVIIQTLLWSSSIKKWLGVNGCFTCFCVIWLWRFCCYWSRLYVGISKYIYISLTVYMLPVI